MDTRAWINGVRGEGIRVKEELDLKTISLGFSDAEAEMVEKLSGFPGWDEAAGRTRWTVPVGLTDPEFTSWAKHKANLASAPNETFRDLLYGLVYNAHLQREEETGSRERHSDLDWLFILLQAAKNVLEQDGAAKVDAATQVAMLAARWLENVAETTTLESRSH